MNCRTRKESYTESEGGFIISDQEDKNICPICGKDNKCANALGKDYTKCWCSKQIIPNEIFELVPPDKLGKASICLNCINNLKEEYANTKTK
ncbi:cysteine-rich CWC family protein [Paenibacillus filicis]|uniref:Cysteine-rich CWC family protein n=1 Tax=Paenibacillus gyeongsangnamensis TaxID=3388067 RepID=A0ABT4QGZ5_9BACL|nr:cysteine-rich CWC family protein [Paenibacillus filicis]MCZ8516154.1 cysteine-rich CWC family protein [Paenibacillus filicis]